MRSKQDIKMGWLCTPGGAVLGIVGGGVTFRFLNGEAILDENMLFWVRFSFFPFKKSEQPQIVAFNRIVVNYNIYFLFYLVLTVVRQDTKICNGTTNDFIVKVAYGFSCFYGRERERKQSVLH